jgi:ferredoxin
MRMYQFARKFIAVLLALWLPLFSGSVLAASVSMQFHAGQSHSEQALNEAIADMQQDMQHGDSCEQQFVGSSDAHAATHDHHDKKCTACGVCHLACSGYLAVSDLSGLTRQQPDSVLTTYLLSFNSVSSIPLLPTPLARV